MNIRIRLLEPRDDARLDEFASREPLATIFHTSPWRRAIAGSFQFEPRYLAAEEVASNGKAPAILGVLPLFLVKNLLVAPSLVSTPFAVYGGAVGSRDVRAALVREACALADREGARTIDLRNRHAPEDGFPLRGGYVTFVKDLPSDPGRCLEDLPRKARAAARKGISSDLEAVVSRDDLASFHHLFAVNKRHLGSPTHSLDLFRRLLDEFSDRAFLLMIRHQGQPVAGVLTFTFRDEVVPYFSGGLAEFEKLQTNNFMYLKLMEWGSANGFKRFDFGRSREGTGPYHFKLHQGFEPAPLPYQVIARNGARTPDLSPGNPRFSVPIAMWRRLPLPVTKILGPMVIRYFA